MVSKSPSARHYLIIYHHVVEVLRIGLIDHPVVPSPNHATPPHPHYPSPPTLPLPTHTPGVFDSHWCCHLIVTGNCLTKRMTGMIFSVILLLRLFRIEWCWISFLSYRQGDPQFHIGAGLFCLDWERVVYCSPVSRRSPSHACFLCGWLRTLLLLLTACFSLKLVCQSPPQTLFLCARSEFLVRD